MAISIERSSRRHAALCTIIVYEYTAGASEVVDTEQDRKANSHTIMMISRIQRELEETKDAARKQALQKELEELRASQLK